jgi:hypothetical protein
VANNSRLADSKRGQKSFKPSVAAVFRGEPCDLGRHFEFESALREIVRQADFLASKNTERFIYRTNWDTLDFSKSTIAKSIRILEEMAILTPESKVCDGRLRKGWVVADHGNICSVTGDICTLQTALRVQPTNRKKGQRRWKTPLSTSESTFQSTFPGALSTFQSTFQSTFHENSEYISDAANDKETNGLQESSERKTALSPMSPSLNPVSPVNPVACGDGQSHSKSLGKADPASPVDSAIAGDGHENQPTFPAQPDPARLAATL